MAKDNFERVLQASVGQRGEFEEVALVVGQAEDAPQADAHEFGLMIAAQPEPLVGVVAAVPEVLQDLARGLAPGQPSAEHQFVDQVRGADGDLGKELRSVEQEQQQFEKMRMARPGLKHDGARAISADEAVEPRQDPVRIGEDRNAGGRFVRGPPRHPPDEDRRLQAVRRGAVPACTPSFAAERENSWDELPCQIGRALADVNIAGAVGEFVEQTAGFINVPEAVFGQDPLPFRLCAAELLWERRSRFRGFHFEEFLVNTPDAVVVVLEGGIELTSIGEVHEPGEALARLGVDRNGVGLEIVLHLHSVLDVAQKTVGGRQVAGFALGQELILRHFLQRRKGLRSLQERDATGVEQLGGLGDEFDFADAAAAQLHVAVLFAALDEFLLDAALHGSDFPKGSFAQRARVAIRLDHFQELGAKRGVTSDAAGFDEHHALPGLAPLGVKVLVAAQAAHQRAGISLRAQAQVDAVKGAIGRGARDLGDERFGQSFEELVVAQRVLGVGLLARRLFEDVAFVGVNEEHIHVGTIVEFLSAQLAQADHREPGRLPRAVRGLMIRLAKAVGELPPTELERGVQADIGDVGDFACHLGGAAQAREVARGDAQHLALFEVAKLGEGAAVVLRLERGLEPGLDLPAQSLFLARIGQVLRRQESLGPLGMFEQQQAHRLRAAEERRQDAALVCAHGRQRGAGAPTRQLCPVVSGADRVGGGPTGL